MHWLSSDRVRQNGLGLKPGEAPPLWAAASPAVCRRLQFMNCQHVAGTQARLCGSLRNVASLVAVTTRSDVSIAGLRQIHERTNALTREQGDVGIWRL